MLMSSSSEGALTFALQSGRQCRRCCSTVTVVALTERLRCRVSSMSVDSSDSADFTPQQAGHQDIPLTKRDLAGEPITQFRRWFSQWQASDPYNATAVIVATVDADGWPSARAVLLKRVDERGFVFHTNRRSAKGRDIEATGRASLCFLWHPIERQVRVVGLVDHLPDDESDAYFASRPRGAQIGAWASPQSTVIPDRIKLERLTAATEARFTDNSRDILNDTSIHQTHLLDNSQAGADETTGGNRNTVFVPRPSHWGGYLVRPITVEFWQGRRNRLHDRLCYRRQMSEANLRTDQSEWVIERLAP